MIDPAILPYIGTFPQWMLVIAVVTAAIKLIPRMKELKIGEAAALRGELTEQSIACEKLKSELHKRIDELLTQLWGEKKQRIAEQVALIGLIMKSAPDTAEFQGMLRVLEAVRDQIERDHPSQVVRRVSIEESGEGATE